MFDDANPPAVPHRLGPGPVHNHRTLARVPCGETPRAQPISVGLDSSHTTPMLHVYPSQVEQIGLRVCDRKPLV